MIELKLERIKSAVLFCLVLISIVLTTQIWLNMPIEGIFIISKKTEETSNFLLTPNVEKASFLKPNKLIINNNGNHTLLLNKTEVSMIYERILEDTKNMLIAALGATEGIEIEKYECDYIQKLRAGQTIELQLPFPYDYKLFTYILGVESPKWQGIEHIDAVLVGYYNNNLYLVDKENNYIFEFKSKFLKSNVRAMVDMIYNSKPYSYIFLSEVDQERYSDNVLIPVNIADHSMWKLSAYPESYGYTPESIAAAFFKDKDPSTLRSIIDSEGNIVYTDGEKQGIRISKTGLIEYVNYQTKLESNNSKFTLFDAVNIATNFVNSNLGFPKDSYISSIEQETVNNELYRCLIRYNYRYEGIPIINDDINMDNPIEVEIVNGEVKRYRRIVKNIRITEEEKILKNPLEIIDILLMRLNRYKNIDMKDIRIEDMYMSYLEYGIDIPTSMIPVWVVEIEGDFKDAGKYILNAESGVILYEPY